jgi:hypothetical protein
MFAMKYFFNQNLAKISVILEVMQFNSRYHMHLMFKYFIHSRNICLQIHNVLLFLIDIKLITYSLLLLFIKKLFQIIHLVLLTLFYVFLFFQHIIDKVL